MKYVLVSGGILSGLGKGIVASSTGVLLKSLGFRVTSIKIDPYLNCDAGTMSPFEHGEVFVLDDGGEADLDLGNYERFLDITLTKDNNITTGKIYREVIEKERRGEYLGKTVQIVPHLCNEIQDWIQKVAKVTVDQGLEGHSDVCVIELGGTVGDIESGPFIEAMRQFQFRVGQENFCSIHVSLVPVLGVVGEQKTKPTQQSVQTLRALGIAPDIIVCRSEKKLSSSAKSKIASFCHVKETNVIGAHNVSNIYSVPLLLDSQSMGRSIMEKLCLTSNLLNADTGRLDKSSKIFRQWTRLAKRCDILKNPSTPTVKIAVVGKYTALSDAYLSVTRALDHAAIKVKRRLEVLWISSDSLEESWKNKSNESKVSVKGESFESQMSLSGPKAENETKSTIKKATNGTTNNKKDEEEDNIIDSSTEEDGDTGSLGEGEEENKGLQSYEEAWECLRQADGILVPGGFGDRGIEGKIAATRYARLNNIPFLGICLGMQVVVIEAARDLLKWEDANSVEIDPSTTHPVVIEMPEIDKTQMGGTMRLGKRTTIVDDTDNLAMRIYGRTHVDERHRHRYEVNPDIASDLEKVGLSFVGNDETGRRREIVTLTGKNAGHPFFIGTQFHPEFLSRPMCPSPPFVGLLSASSGQFDAIFPKNK